MKKTYRLLILLIITCPHFLKAQELPLYEWWSLPIINKYSVIQSYPIFHGSALGWRNKGLHSNMQLIDGIDFNSNIGMPPLYQLQKHLQFNTQMISFQKEYPQKTLLQGTGANYVQYHFQNEVTKNTSLVQFKTEQLTNRVQWGIQALLLNKWTAHDPLGPHQQLGVQAYFGNKNAKLWHYVVQISLNHQSKAVQSATAKEVYSILGTSLYNPTWGWYHGQMFFADQKALTNSMVQFSIQNKQNTHHWWQLSVGAIGVTSSMQSLTWTNASDPRPDYYRYLPSFQKDSSSYRLLYQFLKMHPQKLQIDFDNIENINQRAINGISKYVIDKELQKGNQLRGALQWHLENQHHIMLHSRGEWGLDKNNISHQLVDLLGGKYFLNRMQWINDAESGNDFMANINDTSLLHQSSKWGANYTMQHFTIQLHNEIDWRWYKGEWSLEWWHQGHQYLRSSDTQNQLYQNARGVTTYPMRWNHLLAARSTYIFNGRWHLNTLLQVEQVQPQATTLWIDPAIQSGIASLTTPIYNEMHLLSSIYKGVFVDAQIDAYQQFQYGLSGHHSFYHDYYNAFVYGFYGNLNVQTQGVDVSIEKEWQSRWKTTWMGSFKNESIVNAPTYEIRNVNDLFKMESGRLLLKGLPYNNSAHYYFATAIVYKPNIQWQINLDHIWSDTRPIGYNYFKRTEWVHDKIHADSLWSIVQKVETLPSVQQIQANISYQHYVRQHSKIIQWQWRCQVQYFISKNGFPLYVNESTRFDYQHFSSNKFPSKWLLQQPLSIILSLSFKIQ